MEGRESFRPLTFDPNNSLSRTPDGSAMKVLGRGAGRRGAGTHVLQIRVSPLHPRFSENLRASRPSSGHGTSDAAARRGLGEGGPMSAYFENSCL
jgi:hypothetical protein